MRTSFLLITLFALLCGACKSQKKGYLLSIDQDRIEHARDTTMDGKEYKFLWIAAELSNFSNDTLKYMNMTCDSGLIFIFNKRTASIRGWNCDSNFPTYSVITPQKSFTYKLPVLIENNAITGSYTFKIGMYLFKYHGHGSFREFDNFLDSKIGVSTNSNKAVYKNIIWSNEITIPKP